MIALLIPSYHTWESRMALSFAGMCARMAADKIEFTTINMQLSILPEARQKLLQEAINTGHSHAMFIDSDMVFPTDTCHRLFEAQKPIVATNYVVKCIPSRFTAIGLDGKHTDSRNKTGLEQVSRMSLGLSLINLEAIKDLPHPWFTFPWLGEYHGGEDYWFCDKAKEQGIDMWIDHDLSKEIGHVGMYNYSIRDVYDNPKE